MKTYSQFHDGFLEGLRIDKEGKVVEVYLSTLEKERTTAVLSGVVILKAGGFREGNIIFEVSTWACEEITLADVADHTSWIPAMNQRLGSTNSWTG